MIAALKSLDSLRLLAALAEMPVADVSETVITEGSCQRLITASLHDAIDVYVKPEPFQDKGRRKKGGRTSWRLK